MAEPTLDKRARERIDAYFEGRLGAKDTRALFDSFDDDPAAEAYFNRRRLLSHLDPGAPSEQERVARSLGLPAPPEARSFARWLWAPLVAAAAAVLLLVVVRPPARDGFFPRGDDKGAHVTVYEAERGPAGEVIAPDAALAFSLQTPEDAWLMLFAVDEEGRVFWYHPAWTDPEAAPTALRVPASDRPRELPEAVRHALAPGRLRLFALFLQEPLDVKTVEARLPQGAVALEKLPFEGAQWTRLLEVRAPAP